jgi:hypothetical protein
MPARALILAVLVGIFVAPQASADGLIYGLPPDGAWARFRMVYRLWDLTTLQGEAATPSEATLRGTFTLRSVGIQDTAEGPGRWIELESSGPPAEDQDGRIIVLKMLIPERHLAVGADPLAHVAEIYYWSRDWPLDEEPKPGVKERLRDDARIRYEIERFRTFFPFPCGNETTCQSTSDQSVETPMATFSATKITYPMTFSGKLSGGTSGRWSWSGVHTLWLSDKSPFGVVAVDTEFTQTDEHERKSSTTNEYELTGEGVRGKNNVRLELEATGVGAESALPEFPNR